MEAMPMGTEGSGISRPKRVSWSYVSDIDRFPKKVKILREGIEGVTGNGNWPSMILPEFNLL